MANQEKLFTQEPKPSVLDHEPATLSRRKPGKINETVKDLSLRIASIITLLLIWWLLTLFFPPTLVPKPLDTFTEVANIVGGGNFFSEMGSTLRRVGVGFGIAIPVLEEWTFVCS